MRVWRAGLSVRRWFYWLFKRGIKSQIGDTISAATRCNTLELMLARSDENRNWKFIEGVEGGRGAGEQGRGESRRGEGGATSLGAHKCPASSDHECFFSYIYENFYLNLFKLSITSFNFTDFSVTSALVFYKMLISSFLLFFFGATYLLTLQ